MASRLTPTATGRAWVRAASLALYATAAAAIGVAVLADIIGEGGASGFGVRQTVLVLFGCAVAVAAREIAARPAFDLAELLTRERLVNLGRYVVVLGQLVLLVLAARAFQLESPAFHDKIFVLTVAGFAIHELLPAHHRLGFFVLVSLSGILLVFGLTAGSWLIVIGLALISICHLRIAFRARIVLLLAVGTGLALLRAELLPGPVPGVIWPILGSMFMFRLIVYLYDLRHARHLPDWRQTLAYFFLLPNTVFPLFPVVDWTTFRRTYYDEERYGIYQRGVQWILRGFTHLLLYRLVDQYFAISPTEVQSGGEMVRFLVANYMLYLRVSGQFHLIVGMLHLFGFRLPETHHLFFLASSFTDFWRRINIYWKEFMQKVVYYPTFFAVRGRGTTFGIIVATVAVFFATWLLHAYQWFWLLGTVLLTWPDVLFWTVLAVLMVGNSVVESRRGRARSLGGTEWSAAAFAAHAGRTLAFFCVMCVLWSLWSSHGVSEWFSMWAAAARGGLAHSGSAGGLTLLVVVGAVVAHSPRTPKPPRRPAGFLRLAAGSTASILLLYALGTDSAASIAGERGGALLRTLRSNELSRRDAEQLTRGYYENLTGVNRFNSRLWEVYAGAESLEDRRPLRDTDLVVLTHDFLYLALKPDLESTYRGKPFHTNQWGMRDRDYAREPGPGVTRVALLGQSYVMGGGVGDDSTFEAIAERTLPERTGTRWEILNFASGNYMPARQLVQLERTVLDFAPDIVVSVGHQLDLARVPSNIADALFANVGIPIPFVVELLDQLGIGPETPYGETVRRLTPYRDRLFSEIQRAFVDACIARGAVPVYMLIPTPDIGDRDPDLDFMLTASAAAGFQVFDLTDVYAATPDPRTLWVADWDTHPNEQGHRMIAERFAEILAGLTPSR